MNRTRPKTPSLDESTRMLKAFADPVRLRLLNLLSEDNEVCVCHLHGALQLPQPTVSRHLAYLRKHGLVVGRKEGLWVHYRRSKPKSSLHRTLVESIGNSLADLDVFQQDRKRLSRVLSCCGSPTDPFSLTIFVIHIVRHVRMIRPQSPRARGRGLGSPFRRFLTLWIFLAMVVGFCWGPRSVMSGWLLGRSVSPTRVAVGLILMMYPPLARVRPRAGPDLCDSSHPGHRSSEHVIGVLMFGDSACLSADRPSTRSA